MNNTTVNQNFNYFPFNTTYLLTHYPTTDNIIIYNGDLLPDNIRDSVTRSIENLFLYCQGIYDTKIYRSNNVIWYVLSRNLHDYYSLMVLKNTLAKCRNNEILKNAIRDYPRLIQTNIVNYTNTLYLNLFYDFASVLSNVENVNLNENLGENLDLLA